jgi:nucleoside-diphosphate-sugar epimerase
LPVKIFVAGATGVIGRRTLPLLVTAGHEVAAAARSADNAKLIGHFGARPINVDLFDRRGLEAAVAGCDAVINLATHMPSSSLRALLPGAWRENDRIRRAGAANLADAARAGGVRRLLQESFAPAYPDRADQWIDETVPIAPARYNRTIVDAERAAERFAEDGRSGIVLRFGAFYGPDAVQFGDLVSAIRRGFAPLPSRPEAYISSISHDDAATAVVACLRAPGGIYNIVDDEPVRRRDYFDALAQVLDVPPPRIPPHWMAYLIGSVGPLLARSQRMSNRKLRGAIGWAPKYPSVRDGWPATLREWRDRAGAEIDSGLLDRH